MPLITVTKRSCENSFKEEGQHSGCQKVPVALVYHSAAVISRDRENNQTVQVRCYYKAKDSEPELREGAATSLLFHK